MSSLKPAVYILQVHQTLLYALLFASFFPCSASEGCLFCLLALSPSWLPSLAGPAPHAIGWGDAGTLTCRPAWHHKSPALPPATLTLMQWAHTRDVLALSLLCTLLALVSLSLSDHWIWFWRDSDVFWLWIILYFLCCSTLLKTASGVAVWPPLQIKHICLKISSKNYVLGQKAV